MRIIYSHKCSIHQYYRPSLFHASCNTIRGTMATYQGTIAQLLVSILGKLSIAIFPFASRSRLITGIIKKSNIASAKCWQLKKKDCISHFSTFEQQRLHLPMYSS